MTWALHPPKLLSPCPSQPSNEAYPTKHLAHPDQQWSEPYPLQMIQPSRKSSVPPCYPIPSRPGLPSCLRPHGLPSNHLSLDVAEFIISSIQIYQYIFVLVISFF